MIFAIRLYMLELQTDIVNYCIKMLMFYKYSNSSMTPPFTSLEVFPYENDSIGVVIHKDDTTLVEDGNLHIYYRRPTISNDEAKQDIRTYYYQGDNRANPPELHVKEGEHIPDSILLSEFLNQHFYEAEEYDEETREIDGNPFSIFVKEINQHISGSLEQYIEQMFHSMGIPEAFNHVKYYISDFHVALTDQDVNPNSLSNYELLEFLGDLCMWEPINRIFIEYAKEYNIPITEAMITSMHRSFASKNEQSKISKKLQLATYLKKKGTLTITVHEDILESFTGALYLINFKIRSYLGVNYKLHEVFLRWIYAGRDLSDFEINPEITKFYNYMRIFTGTSMFAERNRGRLWTVKIQNGAKEIITEKLKDERIVNKLFELIERPYGHGESIHDARRIMFGEINEFIEKSLGLQLLQKMQNERSLSEWEEDERIQFEELANQKFPQGYSLNQRFTDKSRTISYWILKVDDITYSTADYDQSESPSVLISLLRDEIDSLRTIEQTKPDLKVHDGTTDYFKDKNGNKFTLIGNPLAIEKYIIDAYERKDGEYYLKVEIDDEDGNVEIDFMKYDPKPEFEFEKLGSEELRFINKILTKADDFMPELPSQIHKYIGSRATESFTALIAILKQRITNPHHLTAVRNFYRSKSLKTELTRILNYRNPMTNELMDFDHILGLKLSAVESVINYIYMKLKIGADVIYKYEDRVRSLRRVLSYENERKKKRTEDQNLSYKEKREKLERERKELEKGWKIFVFENKYVYTASDNKMYSVEITGHHYERLKNLFAKYVFEVEMKLHKNITSLRNSRFSAQPGFDALKQYMQFLSVTDWQLNYETKDISGRKYLVLRYFKDDQVFYVSGTTLESINKQLI
jgi:hypothetical protein